MCVMYVYFSINILNTMFLLHILRTSAITSKLHTCDNFFRDVEMDNRKVFIDDFRNGTHLMKFGDCIKLCAEDSLCKSIFYHSGISTCVNVQYYVSRNISVPEFGWIYMEKQSCCQTGWVQFQKHCYLFKKENFNLSEAQAFCTKERGYLVEIVTRAVQEFLKQNMIKENIIEAWTGGLYDNERRQWKWAHSGQLFAFNNWSPYDPNGDGVAMIYTLFYSGGRWGDIPSGTKKNVVCQTDRKLMQQD